MGLGFSVRKNIEGKSRISTKLLIDVPLLVAVILLLISGLLMLYSASWNFALQQTGSGISTLMKQVEWMVFGLILAFILSALDYHWVAKYSGLSLLFFGIVLFIMLLASRGEGDNSVYSRSVLNNGSIQPSEAAKLSLVCFLAYWLARHQEHTLKSYVFILSVTVVLAVIVGISDYSTAIMMVVLLLTMIIISGGDIRAITTLFLLGSMLAIVGYFLFPFKIGVRIDEFVSGLKSPQTASYHIQRALDAVLAGGYTGVGIGKGTVKMTGLPVAWTDSIFAVILEETGLLGGMYFIGLYLVILWRGWNIFNNALDETGRLMAAGVTSWIFMEAVLNIGVLVNLFPFAGNALPFVSYGGSSMLIMMAAVGILISISRVSQQEKIKEGRRNTDALINLRRGDGGWSISRSGSPAGKE